MRRIAYELFGFDVAEMIAKGQKVNLQEMLRDRMEYTDKSIDEIQKEIDANQELIDYWQEYLDRHRRMPEQIKRDEERRIAYLQLGFDAEERIRQGQIDGLADMIEARIKHTNEQIYQVQREIESNDKLMKDWRDLRNEYTGVVDNLERETLRANAIRLLGYNFEKDIIAGHKVNLTDMISEQIRYTNRQIDEKNREIEANNERKRSWEAYRDTYSNIVSDIERENQRLIAIQQLGFQFEKDLLEGRKINLAGMLKEQIKHTDAVIKQKENEIKANESQIESWKVLKSEWDSVVTNHRNGIEAMNAAHLMGADFERRVLNDRISELQKFVANYNALMSSLQSMPPMSGGSGGSPFVSPPAVAVSPQVTPPTQQPPTLIITGEREAIIEEMQRNSFLWHHSSPEGKQELSERNLYLGAKMGWTRDAGGVWIDELGNRAYKQGGVVDFDGLAMMHGGNSAEMVLNNNDVAKVHDLIHTSDNLTSGLLGASKLIKVSVAELMDSNETFKKLMTSGLSVADGIPNRNLFQPSVQPHHHIHEKQPINHVEIGDIHIHEQVGDVDGLARAINNNIRNLGMQFSFSKRR
jgi:hypothetical protein